MKNIDTERWIRFYAKIALIVAFFVAILGAIIGVLLLFLGVIITPDVLLPGFYLIVLSLSLIISEILSFLLLHGFADLIGNTKKTNELLNTMLKAERLPQKEYPQTDPRQFSEKAETQAKASSPTVRKNGFITCPNCGRKQIASNTECWQCGRKFDDVVDE